MQLATHGLELIDPEPRLFVPVGDGRNLILGRSTLTAADSGKFFNYDGEPLPW